MSSIAYDKSVAFAIRIVHLYKHLIDNKKEFVMAKQILRSGTSIGANLAEARFGISDKDFLSKIYISLKECSETAYWLNLLHKTDYITDSQFESINSDCVEIMRILNATTKTMTKPETK